MKLTREKALELHYQMWGDMQNDLGDNPLPILRAEYKEKWISKHFPGQKVLNDCFLCEFADLSYYGSTKCLNCPVNWDSLAVDDKGYCFAEYIGGGEEDAIYLDAPISEILALPEREV